MTTTTEMITTDEALRVAVRETIGNHRNLVVKDDAGYITAQEALRAVKCQVAKVLAYFGPLVKQAHEMHKALKAKENELTGPLDDVYKSIAVQCSRYSAEKEAEARRLAAEEDRRRRKEEEDRRLDEAATLEAQGRKEEAETMISAPIQCAPAPIQRPPQVQNVSYRDSWKFIIDDVAKIPREFMVPDDVKIGQYVRAMKGNAVIPGVKIYCEKTPTVRQ